MADVDNVMGVDSADIASIMGVARADIASFMGVDMPSLGDWKGTKAFYFGGSWYTSSGALPSTHSNQIQYKTMTSDGNMADFADLTVDNHNHLGSGSNGTRILRGGGNSEGSGNSVDLVTVDYFVCASAVNGQDAGDLAVGGRWVGGGSSNGTLCMFYGGERFNYVDAPYYNRDKISYQDISTTGGDSDDGGELTAPSYAHETSSGDSKALIIGISTANSGTSTSVIDEHNMSSTSGNASDYGSVDTEGHKNGAATMSSSSRVVIAGGVNDSSAHDEVHYLPVASDNDSTDAADLTYSAFRMTGTSDGTRGEAYGGISGSYPNYFVKNVIQKFTLASLENGSDIGDLVNEDTDAASTAHDYGEKGSTFGAGAQTGIL